VILEPHLSTGFPVVAEITAQPAIFGHFEVNSKRPSSHLHQKEFRRAVYHLAPTNLTGNHSTSSSARGKVSALAKGGKRAGQRRAPGRKLRVRNPFFHVQPAVLRTR